MRDEDQMDVPLSETSRGAQPPKGEAPRFEVQGRESEPPSENRTSMSLGPLTFLGFGPSETEATDAQQGPFSRSSLVTAAALVIVIAAVKVGRPVLVPFTVSVFLATLAVPAVLYLRRLKVPTIVAVGLVVAAGLLFFGGIFALVGGTLNAFVKASPMYQERLIGLVLVISTALEGWGIRVDPGSLYSLIQPEQVIRFVGDTLSEIADMLSSAFLVMLMTVFVIFEALVLPQKIRKALSDPEADLSRGIRVVSRIKAYVVVKSCTSLATGVVVGIVLQIMGVDFALLWGLLAFFLNFIPNIGSVIAAVPPVLVALLQQGWGGAIATAVLFFLVNVIIGSVIEPKVMGRSMNLSPMIVFASLLFWGWLWGGIGMLLSVPLTMAIRIMLDGHDNTRPFAILMAGSDGDRRSSPATRNIR